MRRTGERSAVVGDGQEVDERTLLGEFRLWLAFHDDLADSKNTDAIARESTRLLCAAVVRAQTTLDPQQMRQWIPNARYGARAFGFNGDAKAGLTPFQEFLNSREKIQPWIREYSPYELVSADDPPVGLYYDTAPAQEQESSAHSANFGAGLIAKLQQIGVDYEFVYPGAPGVRHPLIHQYLIAKLQVARP